jgi:hypothetical protein
MPASMHRNADERVASESFLESTFIDQNNPTRQTAGPYWGSSELGLLGLAYHDARGPQHRWGIEVTTTTQARSSSHVPRPAVADDRGPAGLPLCLGTKAHA